MLIMVLVLTLFLMLVNIGIITYIVTAITYY